MKKVITIILALAMLLTSVAAFAEPANMQGGPGGGPQMNGQMPGNPPSGEKPDFANGERPELPSGEAPAQNDSNGPMGGMPGGSESENGKNIENGIPGMIDFDAMAANNVISAETLEKIKAYMEANKPDDLPEMNGQAPEMNGQAPEMNGQKNLLDELLENNIITQEEYDALNEAWTAAQATANTTTAE